VFYTNFCLYVIRPSNDGDGLMLCCCAKMTSNAYSGTLYPTLSIYLCIVYLLLESKVQAQWVASCQKYIRCWDLGWTW